MERIVLELPPPIKALGLQILFNLPPKIEEPFAVKLVSLEIPITKEHGPLAILEFPHLNVDPAPEPAIITPPPPPPVLNPDAVTVEPFVFVKVRTPVPEL